MDDMDWKAAMDSEVFREYAQNWLRKDAHIESTKAQIEHEEAERKAAKEREVQASLEDFRKKLAENPALEAKLKQARDYLIANPDMVSKVDPNFVRGVTMLLDFEKSAEEAEEISFPVNEVIEVSEEEGI